MINYTAIYQQTLLNETSPYSIGVQAMKGQWLFFLLLIGIPLILQLIFLLTLVKWRKKWGSFVLIFVLPYIIMFLILALYPIIIALI